MSMILQLLGATPTVNRNPDDDRWWGGAARSSVAGVHVDADTALKLSTAWACVTLLSETIASLPLVVYRRIGEDGRERARSHPLYTVLHDQPNQWQTAAEFREMMTGHALVRGNAYAQIMPGPRGPVDQLVPLHPDRVTPEKLGNGRLRYQVLQDNGSKKPFNQEDIFHLRGPSKDGITGMSVIDYARDSFGLSLAAERYGSRFFRNDSRPGGALKTPNKLSKDAAGRLKSGWEAAHASGNQHRVAVLEEGLEWQQIGIAPEEAQFLETREFQAEDVCRWFRVPPHMVGLTSKATSWGSGIEQMSIGFVTYTLMPWLTRWQQAISRDLIIAVDTYFAQFIVEGLLRGDIGSRYAAYAIGRQWGWLSTNDVRRLENMNPVDDGDDYLRPLNMLEAGEELEATARSTSPVATSHYRLLAEEAAGRLVRKEIAAVRRLSSKLPEQSEQWQEAVRDFYSDHVDLVAQTMRISLARAQHYCSEQIDALTNQGVPAFEDREQQRVTELAQVAIGETRQP